MGNEFGLDPWRMGGLTAPLTDLAVMLAQEAVHRGLRAQLAALVEQDRVHLTGCQVNEAFLVEHLEHSLPFSGRQGAWLRPGHA